MAKFGELLKELRRSRGLSQVELAEKLGWNQSKISHLEGSEEIPKEDDLRVICDWFAVGPSYFYERREDKKPQALDYLRSLASDPPEHSPKAAIAFYSQVHQLSPDEQEEVEKLARQRVRPKRKR